MKVFCPNCGSQNEGMPGGRLTCRACTASFEVPREGAVSPQVSPPPSSSPFPTGYVGQPPAGFGGSSGLASGQLNPLAIVSMVLGLLCCLPFALGAIITGVIAQNQIKASNGQQRGKEFALAGIILGTLSIAMNILWTLVSVLGRIH